MRRSLTIAAVAVLAIAAGARLRPPVGAERVAHAQSNDWSVKRNPFDRRIVARLKATLRRHPHDAGAFRRLARMYKRYRSLARLIGEYRAELGAHPHRASAAILLGRLYTMAGKSAPAIAAYKQAAALAPRDGRIQQALADLYRQGGDRADARARYEQALKLATGRGARKKLLRQLSQVAAAAGDPAAARGYLARYLKLAPKDIDARIELGEMLSQQGLHDRAIAVLKRTEALLGSDPQRRVRVIARLGAAYDAAGRTDAALRAYRRAISLTHRGYYLRKELTDRIIDIYRRRQDLGSLVKRYESKWPPKRRDAFQWSVLARLYEETGHEDKAIAAYRRAIRKAPYDLDTQRRLITLLEHSGHDEQAIRQYRRVIRIAPGAPQFQLKLAEQLWRRGDHDKAVRLLERVQRRFPRNESVCETLADLYTRWGKKDLALAEYKRLAHIDPSEPSHLVDLGEQYFERGRKKKAIAIWKRLAAGNTAKGDARLGEVYAEHDMLVDALVMYTKAIKLAPRDPKLFKGRAGVYERQQRWTEAIADWKQVLALCAGQKGETPLRHEARQRVINLLKRAGGHRLASSMRGWQHAFDGRPPDLGAGHLLVEAHLRLGQIDKARRVLERLLALAPGELDAEHQLVKVYRAEREYDKAVKLLLALAKTSPGRKRDYYNEIAEIKTIQNKDREAIFYAEKALRTSPNDPVAHEKLAERFEDMQKYEKAIAAYEKTIELDPRNFDAYFALARLYRNEGELNKEAKLYEQVLRRSGDPQVLLKAGRDAIDLDELTGSLGKLERVVAPLAFTFGQKDIYRRILVDLYGRYVPELVDQRLHGDAAARAAAEAELKRLGAHGLRPLLAALADDKDVSQQRIAVSVLGFLGNKGAAAPLVELARRAPDDSAAAASPIGTLTPTLDWDMRVKALVAAGRLGEPRTIPALIELTHHREVAMREAATFALGMTGDRRAARPLLAALDDRRDSVEMLACLGLARLDDHRATDALTRVVTDTDRRDETRAACAYALGVIGDRRAAPALAKVLASGNDEVQRLSAWALGRIGDKSAVPALLSAYFGRRRRIRVTVAWALAALAGGHPPRREMTSFLRYPMRDGKFDAKAAAAGLAWPLEQPALVPQVITGHESDIARGIRAALGRHRDTVVRVLGDLDRAPDRLSLGLITAGFGAAPAAARAQVARSLHRIGLAIAPALVPLTHHRDPEVRRRAVSVLAKTGSPAAAAAIVATVNDPDAAVSAAAMRAAAVLARAASPRAAAALAAAVAHKLSAKNWQVRLAAARALGEFGPRADTGALARALAQDRVGFVRQQAARALGRIGQRRSVPPLLAATHDPLSAVRLAAVKALVRIGDPRARRRLRALAGGDPDPAVRAAASR